MFNEKGLYLLLFLIVTVSIFASLKNFFVKEGIIEGFTSAPTYSADFNADLVWGMHVATATLVAPDAPDENADWTTSTKEAVSEDLPF